MYEYTKEKDEMCVICQCNFELKDKIMVLPCFDKFHESCLEPYLIEYNNKCPICKKEIEME